MRRGVFGASDGGLQPEWSLSCLAVTSPDVPQRPNFHDCGLFALSFFRSFFACSAGERSSLLLADGVGTRAWAENFHLLTRAVMRNLCKTLTEREPDAKSELVDARPRRRRRLRSTRAGAGPSEGAQLSAGPSEGGQPSAGPSEEGQPSAEPSEGGRPSAGPSEGGQLSAGPSEAGRPSAEPSEGGQPSAGPSEGGRPSAAYGPLEQTRHTGLGPSIRRLGTRSRRPGTRRSLRRSRMSTLPAKHRGARLDSVALPREPQSPPKHIQPRLPRRSQKTATLARWTSSWASCPPLQPTSLRPTFYHLGVYRGSESGRGRTRHMLTRPDGWLTSAGGIRRWSRWWRAPSAPSSTRPMALGRLLSTSLPRASPSGTLLQAVIDWPLGLPPPY